MAVSGTPRPIPLCAADYPDPGEFGDPYTCPLKSCMDGLVVCPNRGREGAEEVYSSPPRDCMAHLQRPHPWHWHRCRRAEGHEGRHRCQRCRNTWDDEGGEAMEKVIHSFATAGQGGIGRVRLERQDHGFLLTVEAVPADFDDGEEFDLVQVNLSAPAVQALGDWIGRTA